MYWKLENRCYKMSAYKAKCTKFDFRWGSSSDPVGSTALSRHRSLYFYLYGKGEEGKGKGFAGPMSDSPYIRVCSTVHAQLHIDRLKSQSGKHA